VKEEFEAYRALLFTIAYRMTGSAADAEDLVQDAYVRYASADREIVRDVKAFLVTILTRLALDKLKSAQKQREEYIGPWLPEPVFTGIDGDPYARATRDEKIEMALLRTLELLSPQERAVLLLYEVLDHDHNEIADLLGITSAASRQLLHRAKERVAAEKQRFTPPPEQQRRLMQSFIAAAVHGDVAKLRNLLAEDVVALADSGGKGVSAARRPIQGADAVSRLLVGIIAKAAVGIVPSIEEVNGQLAIVGRRDGAIASITMFKFDGDRIAEVASFVNPDKLEFAKRQRSAAGPAAGAPSAGRQ
jgi:RNA polymerase sigma-70 factor (ECF subfamily)